MEKIISYVDYLAYLADYYGVSLDYLVVGKEPNGLSQEELDLIDKYKTLSSENRRNITTLIDSMLSVPAEGENSIPGRLLSISAASRTAGEEAVT
ncbi:MAG: hypothetical protein FWC06_08235 [Treponema sp.]|nr:hypothetical protein [Treponema sp.]